MKKLLLCAFLCMLPSYVLAGNINNIRIKNAGYTMGTNANEYHEIGGNQVFECDDAEGDVDNGVFLYYLSSNNIQISAKQCVLEWSGDYFQEVPISWCHNDGTYNCDKAQTIRMTESRSVCASGVVRKLDPVGFSNGSEIGCIFCNEGYVKSGSDCVPVNSVCSTKFGTINVGFAHKGATKQDCTDSGAKILEPKGLEFEMICRPGPTLVCKASKCPNEYTPNRSTGKCDPAKIAQVFTWQTQYANNSQISAQITAILQYCDDIHRTELQFNSMYNQLQILINNANDAAELNQRQTSSRRNIERAMSDIDSITSTLDRSSWKNADGGFNTSRLLSDSIAGVVLGTAGGLITSHLVKKNQVESGFEDIQCTVGGQVVANWGDEFQVGIQ